MTIFLRTTLFAALASAFLVPIVNEALGASLRDIWGAITTPTRNPPSVFGGYANGCLDGAVSLPIRGDGYYLMRITRRRFYGHPSLIGMVQKLGTQASQAGLGVVRIGDMAQPRGGPLPGSHHSHQSGLDVDIWFEPLPADMSDRITLHDLETMAAPSMVLGRINRINRHHWNPDKIRLLKIAAQAPEVDRIFVNATIKQALCKEVPGEAWLNKIRPWWSHVHHFHVRLRCPANNPGCTPQTPVPPGDGCGKDLHDWFNPPKKTAKTKPDTPKPPRPPMPSSCEKVRLFDYWHDSPTIALSTPQVVAHSTSPAVAMPPRQAMASSTQMKSLTHQVNARAPQVKPRARKKH